MVGYIQLDLVKSLEKENQAEEPIVIGARRLFQRALLMRSDDQAERAVGLALNEGLHPLEIHQQVIVPGLVAIGEMWHSGEIGITEEHIATQISLQQMNRLHQMIRPKPELGKKAVIAAFSTDNHWLGAKIVADFFYHDGWDVDFIGTSPPVEDLIVYLQKAQPDLLVVSVTVLSDELQLKKLFDRSAGFNPGLKLIFGGRYFEENPAAVRRLSSLKIARTPAEAVQIARKLCSINSSAGALDQILRTVGSNIQQGRKNSRLSQKQLAELAELDRAYISAIERGKQNLTLAALHKLASALDSTIEDLIRAQ